MFHSEVEHWCYSRGWIEKADVTDVTVATVDVHTILSSRIHVRTRLVSTLQQFPKYNEIPLAVWPGDVGNR
jgi:hypothetical protein